MKTITINATCRYTVEITTDVPDEIFDQLCDVFDNRSGEISDSDLRNEKALGWLGTTISEADALSHDYELNEITEYENDDQEKRL